MKIDIIASSSSGNCYIIDDGVTRLLLEGGIPYRQLIRELNKRNLKLTDFVGCVISHGHNDHSCAMKDIARFIPIYASQETLGEMKGVAISHATKTAIGTYTVIPFETEHDCPGSLGFIISSTITKENLMFMTDAKYTKYSLKQFPFDYVMIECNYVDELLDNDEINYALKKRLLNSHMSLTTCIKTLKSLNLNRCKVIFLIHLSDHRSDEALMKKAVAREFGIPVYVAGKHGGYR